jgi:hypothetical protein
MFNDASDMMPAAWEVLQMRLTTLLVSFSMFGLAIDANGGVVVSLTGPDGGGEVISTDRFVSFRWLSNIPHDVSVFAKLAVFSASDPFVGTAYITSGPCCTPDASSPFAQSEFTVTSETPSFIELFQGLTLPPNTYYLTLAGVGSGLGLWVIADPFAFLMTGPDSGLAGGDLVAQGPNIDTVFPPASQFTSNGKQTQFIVIEGVEPSSFLPVLGLVTLLTFRMRFVERRKSPTTVPN